MIDKSNRLIKPSALTVLPDNIPAYLKNIPQWVGWRWIFRDNRWTKPPINMKNGDQHASSTDPSTWVSFETAISVYQNDERGFHLDGIGLAIMPTNNLVAVDWDSVFDPDTQTVLYDADTAAQMLNTYIEWSPTHSGYRGFLIGRLPPTERRSGSIEMYNSGRYMTITGHKLLYAPGTIESRQPQIEAFHADVFKEKLHRKTKAKSNVSKASVPVLTLLDHEVIEKAGLSTSGSKFDSLYHRKDLASYSNDHSAADLALCNMLAFWCQKDEVQIDRIFRSSSLMRDKWDRPDYRTRTIEIAVRECKEVYSPDPTPTVRIKVGKRSIASEIGDEEETEDPEYGSLPCVEIKGRQLRHVTDEALKCIVEANNPPEIFVINNNLSRLDLDEFGKMRPSRLTIDSMTGILARKANWFKDDSLDVVPPAVVVRDILSLGKWQNIPVIRSIVTSPVLSSDRLLINSAGYHEGSGIFYDDFGEKILDQNVTHDRFENARSLILDEMLGDFPFADEASKANAVAFMLLPVLRTAIPGPVPMTIFDAPVPGTGKSLLAEIILLLYAPNGVPARSCPPQDKDDEWRKTITTALLNKSQFFFLDNVKGGLHNASLQAAITSTGWTDRILGGNEQAELLNTMIFVATANNITMDAEQSRRTVWVRLDANVERPEQRTGFRHKNIRLWVLKHRLKILAALVMIVKAWIKGGLQPARKELPTLGSFETYVETVGAVMEYVMPGFLGNREKQVAAISDGGPWHTFTEAWFDHHGEKRVGVADLFEIGRKYLPDVLGDKSDTSQRTRLAHGIAKNADRVFNGMKIESLGIGESYTGVRMANVYKLTKLN